MSFVQLLLYCILAPLTDFSIYPIEAKKSSICLISIAHFLKNGLDVKNIELKTIEDTHQKKCWQQESICISVKLDDTAFA